DAGLLGVGRVGEGVVLADLVAGGVVEGEGGAAAVLVADAVLAGLPAGVVEALLGSGEVAGRRDVLGEPGVVAGGRALGGAARAVEDPVDDGLAVDGQVEGAADRGVAGDGVPGGEGDGAEVVGGGPVRRALVVVLEGGGEVGRQRRAVEVTGAQPGGADV